MRILIVRNNYNPKAIEASYLLEAFFDKQNIAYTTYDCDALRCSEAIIDQNFPADNPPFNLAVVLGGDGTILCTAGQIKTLRIPILGINFGHLGFITNPNNAGVIEIVSAALAGEVACEARTNLRIDVYCEESPESEEEACTDPILKGEAVLPQRFFALNEIVVARGDQGRMIHFDYSISGTHMADMRSDGLVVASATGSTGYALSAGGPLIDPSYQGLVAVPIAPHTLQSRAVVTGSSDVIEIDLDTSMASRAATLFIDGERVSFASPIRKIVVATGEEPTLLLRYQAESFYNYSAEAFFGARASEK
jgi:NAD+ kinase